MVGAGRAQFLETDVVLHCLEGQVALLRHVMAFEEASHGRKVLTDTQRWKATFAAYFLSAVSQSQLTLLERTTLDTADVSYTSSHNWVIKTSKKLSFELRHNANRSLSRLNDAQELQAFKWAPMKILAFLLSNSKSQFAIHLQLPELMYDKSGEWDIYISLSAVHGHTRYSHVASSENYGKELSITELMGLGWVFHCTNNSNESTRKGRTPVVKDARWTSQKQAVYKAGRRYTLCTLVERPVLRGAVILYGKDIFHCQIDYWKFYQAGHKLYLTGNGVVLSYVDVPVDFLYFGNRPSGSTTAGSGSTDSAPGAGSSSGPGRGSMDKAPGKAQNLRAQGRKVEAKVCLRRHLSPRLSTPQASESPLATTDPSAT